MDMELKNLVEDVVIKKYEKMKSSFTGCQCEKCKYDIILYTLNHLPPKYIASSKGELYAKLDFLDQQFETNIITTLMNASELIRKNPRHEQNT